MIWQKGAYYPFFLRYCRKVSLPQLMAEYNFTEIEKNWQDKWREQQLYIVTEDPDRIKYYVLDMFPYPSGAGLHVGHPLGYIASDIFARYKRLCGFNVLHPMGFDSFGLPAEQYAIQTGQHPSKTTEENIKRYREQLDKIGFSFDWSRQVETNDQNFYKWTQWIFSLLFESWYNKITNKGEPITELISAFEKAGNANIDAACDNPDSIFTSEDWNLFNAHQKSDVLMEYRLAFQKYAAVNWCPALGTVLANDEVKDGVSERGGHPVERKEMRQWSLRISAYADRLLDGLEKINWPEPLKETQRNWIGKSKGALVEFKLQSDILNYTINVFTTRPDTLFGVTFVTIAPEHELVKHITTPEYKTMVEEYVGKTSNRSERERMADVKNISGQFTGAYVEHPFSGKKIPVWVGDYVLAGYGTGAVMAVPAHDSRDFAFAKHFRLAVQEVVEPLHPSSGENSKGQVSYDEKSGTCINSDFLNGLEVYDAINRCIEELEKTGKGKGKVNFKLRDAGYSRQRYWGEPFPIVYKDGIPELLPFEDLPVTLPDVQSYQPTGTGEGPLAALTEWKNLPDGRMRETDTMPGYAGSSWYLFRYMDPNNTGEFASKKALDYWQQVDLYMGGSEHATGHLLYVRFWTKFLHDRGYISVDEPAKRLINQGMLQGVSEYMYLINTQRDDLTDTTVYQPVFFSYDKRPKIGDWFKIKGSDYNYKAISEQVFRIEAKYVDGRGRLYQGKLNSYSKTPYFVSNIFDTIDKFIVQWESDEKGELYIQAESFVEKMSKSKWNVVNPDEIIAQYGADTLRLYEMFLGPIEQSKPWNTQGIEGVHRFLKKLWSLFYTRDNEYLITNEEPTLGELKIIHKTIKKATEDIEGFSFNTSVSAFMIAVNELLDAECHKRAVLEPLLVLISAYAPHICEELWSKLGKSESIIKATWPELKSEYLVENSFSYPVSVNGKTRVNIDLPLELTQQQVEERILADETVQKWLEGKAPKKIVFVKGRIVNVVV